MSPRTAYAWLSTSVTTQWEQKPLGLFLMEETVNNEFAAERFGSKATASVQARFAHHCLAQMSEIGCTVRFSMLASPVMLNAGPSEI